MGALPVEGPRAVYVYADLTDFLKVFWLVQSVLDTSQARSGPSFGIPRVLAPASTSSRAGTG